MGRMSPDVAKSSLGVNMSGMLSPCPDSPNCVCSHYPQDKDHYAVPLKFSGTANQAKDKLKSLLKNLTRCELVDDKDLYLRYEFTSWIMRFVDDLEFLFVPTTQQIHFRSASRVGYSDLGANAQRIAMIRDLWERR